MKKCLMVCSVKQGNGLSRYCENLQKLLQKEMEVDYLNFHYECRFFKNVALNGYITLLVNFLRIFLGINQRKLVKYLHNKNYDYIIVPFQQWGYFVPSIKKLGYPVLTVIHDFMSYNIHKNSFLHTILRSVCINKAFQSDKIVFISEDAKKDFLDLKIPFGGEYTIIPNFIDTDQFYQTTNQSTLDDIYDKYQLPKKKIFIFVASSGHYKNNLTFLKIAHVFKEYHFIKVGDIDSECKQYIKDNGVTNVQLLHALPIDDLRALYTIAEACIYPSTKEGFGYPPYEALFCGTKVLTTQAIDLKRAPGIYIVDDFYDVEKYKIGLNILLKETLVFKDKDIYIWKKILRRHF